MSTNVLGDPLIPCSSEPLTGFTRNSYCVYHPQDQGKHIVCAVMTDEFLKFSQAKGNDLITPRPEWDFPGLEDGDHWCLCLSRWIEAFKADMAPPVVLEATHISVLEYVDLDVLKACAYEA